MEHIKHDFDCLWIIINQKKKRKQNRRKMPAVIEILSLRHSIDSHPLWTHENRHMKIDK